MGVGFGKADETLFLELARSGYDLSSLRDNTETQSKTEAEIVKIGSPLFVKLDFGHRRIAIFSESDNSAQLTPEIFTKKRLDIKIGIQ